MKLFRLFLLSPVLIAGCHSPPPEGVYPCTTANDCFPMWVCRPDLHCWSQPLPVDAGVDAATDGSTPDAAVPDAPMLDAGCVVETCNGRDDDCDGLVDEGRLTVGPPVVASTAPDFIGGLAVPLDDGFGLIASPRGSVPVTDAAWTSIDVMGTSTSSVTRVMDISAFFDTRSSGTQAVVSTATASGGGLLVVDFASPATSRSSFVFDHGSGDFGLARLASFDGTHATAFVLYGVATGTLSLWRSRVDLGASDGVLIDEVMLATEAYPFSTLHTTTVDYVVYVAAGEIVLASAAANGHTETLDVIGTVTSSASNVSALALAIRDATRPVGTTNPIAVSWATTSPGTVSFAEVTATSPFAVSPARPIASSGPAAFLIPFDSISIEPVPSPTAAAPSHWTVAIDTIDSVAGGNMQRVQVFEVTHATIRELSITDETFSDRQGVDLATSNGVMRLVEANAAGQLVTRAIGCE